MLGKTIPAQLVAATPLIGGHANHYRRGVGVGEVCGLETAGTAGCGLVSAPNSCACPQPA